MVAMTAMKMTMTRATTTLIMMILMMMNNADDEGDYDGG